jgi:hypothetical protein
MWKFFGWGMGIVGIVVGFGIVATGDPLMHLCRKGCWLNGLLLAVFGEEGGRIALGYLWAILGGLIIARTITSRNRLPQDPERGESRETRR